MRAQRVYMRVYGWWMAVVGEGGRTNGKEAVVSPDLKVVPPLGHHTLPVHETIHNHTVVLVHLFTFREESARSRTVRYVVALELVVSVVVTHAQQVAIRQRKAVHVRKPRSGSFRHHARSLRAAPFAASAAIERVRDGF